MEKIKCIDCGNEFDSKKTACPNCGCPVEIKKKTPNKSKNSDSNDVGYLYLTAGASFLLICSTGRYLEMLILLIILYVLFYAVAKIVLYKKSELPDAVQKYLTDRNLNIGLCVTQLLYLVLVISRMDYVSQNMLSKIVYMLSRISIQGIIVILTLLIINPTFIKNNQLVNTVKDNLSLIYKVCLTIYILANVTFMLSYYSILDMICFIPLVIYLYNRKELKKWH